MSILHCVGGSPERRGSSSGVTVPPGQARLGAPAWLLLSHVTSFAGSQALGLFLRTNHRVTALLTADVFSSSTKLVSNNSIQS